MNAHQLGCGRGYTVSAEDEDRRRPEDLEPTPEDADRVKGGVLPIDPVSSDSFVSRIIGGRRRKKKKQQQQIGPYKGKH
jgi:hypothetical protein